MARGVCFAKFLIFSLTTEIPRSSDAFSSRTRLRKLSGLTRVVRMMKRDVDRITRPNSCLDNARIVDVFPVPGGP